jgi:BON domain
MRRTAFVAAIALCVLAPATFAAAQSADDKAMAQAIGSELKESGQLHDYRVGVKYHDGVAVLTGSVASDRQLATAIGLTQHMEGVNRVVNHLTIAEPAAGAGQLELGNSLGHASQLSAKYPRERAEQGDQPASQAVSQASAQMPAPAPHARRNNTPLAMGRMPVQQASAEMAGPMQASCMGCGPGGPGSPCGPMGGGGPAPTGYVPGGGAGRGASYDNAQMPGYAWPSYAAYPNYAAVTYPQQYSPTAWPYIGPFYPYPQVPLGWRKVALEWDDGWWFLDFSDCGANH